MLSHRDQDGIASGERRSLRTYLIEPQTVFVPYLTRLLADAGLGVIATHGIVDGKDIAAHNPAAVFVDVDYFSRGAPNALCRIRQVARQAAIIAFSGSDDPSFEAACYISGASLLLSKRTGTEMLLRALRNVLVPRNALAAPA